MAERNELHKRNRHNGQYDFSRLTEEYPPLKKFIVLNAYGTTSIDFFNPRAVKALNKALLISYYGIRYWDIPKNYLCPPIPGRADYIHYIADLIQPDISNESTGLKTAVPNARQYRCLDIGVGANCIYPIIGQTEYGWTFVGSDIDPVSIDNARKIVTCNPALAHKIELRLQQDSRKIFEGIIAPNEYFDVTLCNPPFHSSKEEAEDGTLRKLSSLKGQKVTKARLNFGGNANELWCEGGELRFLLTMIEESRNYRKNCGWFTSLVSKEKNLGKLTAKLKSTDIAEHRSLRCTRVLKPAGSWHGDFEKDRVIKSASIDSNPLGRRSSQESDCHLKISLTLSCLSKQTSKFRKACFNIVLKLVFYK